ncbi:hypothetical protein PAEPH01_0335 [Pancytospora epiphaga]|nr:hypothetical protein PAEPH01_0335 [Pancytospora epiphaga]
MRIEPMLNRISNGLSLCVVYLSFFILPIIEATPCLGDKGLLKVPIKIYIDEDSAKEVGKYARRLRKPNSNFKFTRTGVKKIDNVKLFFEVIFDQINGSIVNSNVEFEADFVEMLEPRYQQLKDKYCVRTGNIVYITNTFLEEQDNPEYMGGNKLLIIDCAGNNPYLPRRSHIATKNGCGNVAGIIFGDIYNLRNIVKEIIYSMFDDKIHMKIYSADTKFIRSVCTMMAQCQSKFPDFGYYDDKHHSRGSAEDLVAINHYDGAVWEPGPDYGYSSDNSSDSGYVSGNGHQSRHYVKV